MALLFHGTTDDCLASILRLGLRPLPHEPERGVFLSTTPVAGRGGDPMTFAFGELGPERRHRRAQPGHIVVADLPPHRLDLVQEVVTNTEFDIAWQAQRVRDRLTPWHTGSLSRWCLLYWLGRSLADRRATAFEPRDVMAAIETRVRHRAPELREDLTPGQWLRFLDEYIRVMNVTPYYDARREHRRRRVLNAHGITLPEWIEEDSTSRSCEHCVADVFSYEFVLTPLADHPGFADFCEALAARTGLPRSGLAASPPVLSMSSLDRPLADDLAFVVRALQAHVEPYPAAAVERFFLLRECAAPPWTWRDWYAEFPRQAPGLPRAWTADHAVPAPVVPAALRQPDSQVRASHLPPDLIVGAIQVTDGRRLLFRPDRRRGQTLTSLLWREAYRLRAAR
ncbi:hypothetical protein [Yinghuangia sp. YIM S09857]|uniref:hypothetical protein n=1 Tax=Yinghuangia sp. YIM S09857 TaxID=3436929 RepID=UPI003F53D245